MVNARVVSQLSILLNLLLVGVIMVTSQMNSARLGAREQCVFVVNEDAINVAEEPTKNATASDLLMPPQQLRLELPNNQHQDGVDAGESKKLRAEIALLQDENEELRARVERQREKYQRLVEQMGEKKEMIGNSNGINGVKESAEIELLRDENEELRARVERQRDKYQRLVEQMGEKKEMISNGINNVVKESTDATGTFTAWKHHSNIVYGHVHMAKTAGTEVNGELAARYERVCGHKGYSYDAYFHQMRSKQWMKEKNVTRMSSFSGYPDIYKPFGRTFNRGRIPWAIMAEIGYHDCDWVSLEDDFEEWKNVSAQIHPNHLELHVPCRNHIDFFLSMCNYKGYEFNCSSTDSETTMREEIDKCLIVMERFEYDRYKNFTKAGVDMSLKCFNAIPIDPYLQYMGKILQPKRMPCSYVPRITNPRRNQENECLLSNLEAQQKVKDYLIANFDIFGFCERCMGSEDDLLAA